MEGISWHRTNIQNPEGLATVSGDDVGILFGEQPLRPFVRFVGEELFTIKTPELRRPPIVAAIYATYKVDESDAHAFWIETARGGQDYEDKSPSTVLDSDLKAFAETPKGTKVEFAPGKPMQPGNYYGGCINAWNAHRKGKEIDKINWDVSKGTPNPV